MFKKETAPVIPPSDMIVGAADAPVRITIFGDYQSAETRALTQHMNQLLELFAGKINLVFRHFPLTHIHQKAHKAAEAAIAAGQEGKFWEMHQELMKHPNDLGIISLKAHAREVGVVAKRFLEQLMNSDFGWFVQDDIREGLKLGVKEIPFLQINGSQVAGPLTLQALTREIRKALEETGAADRAAA